MNSVAPDLGRRIAESADVVTVALDELLPRADGPEARLTEAMRYAALGPGKRLRPFFVIETGRLFGLPGALGPARRLRSRVRPCLQPRP